MSTEQELTIGRPCKPEFRIAWLLFLLQLSRRARHLLQKMVSFLSSKLLSLSVALLLSRVALPTDLLKT